MTLLELAKKHKAHKIKPYVIHFMDLYDFWLKEPKKLLEVGVYHGGSLRMWAERFPDCLIYGLDKGKKCKTHGADRIKIIIGRQDDKKFMKKLAKEYDQQFDVIIDDGGHKMRDQRVSFNNMFPALKAGGLYVIEDTHTSYWPKWGGKIHGDTMIEDLKKMVDNVNCRAWKRDRRSGREKVDLNYLDQNIKGIHFYPSICFIEKR